MAPPSKVERATEALSMGASGLMLLPPSGDAVLGMLSDVRARHAAERRQYELEAELHRVRRRTELMDRVVRLARGSGHSDAVRAITESINELSGAQGVAVYATFGREGDCVRLSAMGSALELPSVGQTTDVLSTTEKMGARAIPLLGTHGEIGLVVLDGVEPRKQAEVESMADLAAAVLSLVDSRQSPPGAELKDEQGRTYTSAYFHDVAAREIEKAKRHGRRLSIACLRMERGASDKERAAIEEMVLSSVRDTDTLSRLDRDEYFLLMPETGALGAHACRRRLLARAEGDRRARAVPSDRRSGTNVRAMPVAIGVATYPHDGSRLDRLLACARRRASEDEKSVVHGLGLAAQPLADIVDALLGRTMLGAGVRTPYPLDLAAPAVLSLVSSACREARRGGAMSVHVTLQPGLGLATAARQALAQSGSSGTVHVLDVRSTPGCLDIEAMIVQAEHGTWVCCGRTERDRFRGIHAADPLLGDLLLQRLVAAGTMRSG
jgi:GGDEF domain-containing protein